MQTVSHSRGFQDTSMVGNNLYTYPCQGSIRSALTVVSGRDSFPNHCGLPVLTLQEWFLHAEQSFCAIRCQPVLVRLLVGWDVAHEVVSSWSPNHHVFYLLVEKSGKHPSWYSCRRDLTLLCSGGGCMYGHCDMYLTVNLQEHICSHSWLVLHPKWPCT